MEAQPQVEDVQAISHQHDNGEVFEATNLKAARDMCPVLGKMSLEEAGLLLELEAMGKEQIADQQKVPTEKPVVEKVEKVQPEHKGTNNLSEPLAKEAKREIVPEAELLARKVAEPAVGQIGEGIATKPVEPDLYVMLIQQAEAARIAKDAGQESEEANMEPIVQIVPAESLRPTLRREEAHRQVDAKIIEVASQRETQNIAEKQAFTASEYDIKPSDESPTEQAVDVQAATEREAADALPMAEDMRLPSAGEATSDPVMYESEEEAASFNMTELSKPGALMTDEQGIDDTFEIADVMPINESLEQAYFEYNDDGEVLPEIIEAAQLVEDEPTEFIQTESLPITEIAELPASVAQIETTMVQLVETVENDDDTTKVDAILQEIIALPVKLEVALDNKGEVLEEKLEELFVALFEEADIKYSPDLVKSFVKLTESHYFERLFEITAKLEEEGAGLPHEIGTREFLQKLQHGLGAMKQAVIDFYRLGKSILRLYSFSFEGIPTLVS